MLRKSDYSASVASFEDHGFVLGSVHQPVNVLKALAELCQEIAYIAQVLFPTNPPSNSEYEVEVLEHIGQSHMRLESWIKTLPIEIRPGGERPISGPFFPFAAMLHMQYHQMRVFTPYPLPFPSVTYIWLFLQIDYAASALSSRSPTIGPAKSLSSAPAGPAIPAFPGG
jgi:hypothetical protein